MNDRLGRLWRDLLGRGGDVFIDLLSRQVAVTLEAAQVLRDAQRDDGRDAGQLHDELQRLEARGDDVRAELLTELGRALTTPIDREDLYRLSGSIDDVLDNLRDFAVEMQAYGAEPHERFVAPLEALAEGLEELERAVGSLRKGASDATGAARAAKHANDARDAFHASMSDLLGGDEVTMQTLCHRELLRRLDVTGLRLATAADALTSGALKRG